MSCKICGLKCNTNEFISCIQCERNVCVANCAKECQQGIDCSMNYCIECITTCNVCKNEIEICDPSICKYADELRCTSIVCGLIHKECVFRCDCCKETFCSEKSVHYDETLNECSNCGSKVCNNCFVEKKGCAYYTGGSLSSCDFSKGLKPFLENVCVECVQDKFYNCKGCERTYKRVTNYKINDRVKEGKLISTKKEAKAISYKDYLVFCSKHAIACICCNEFSCSEHCQKKEIGITLKDKVIGYKKATVCDSCCYK